MQDFERRDRPSVGRVEVLQGVRQGLSSGALLISSPFLLSQTTSVSFAHSLISGVSWPASHLDIPVFMTLAMPPPSVNCRDLVTGFSLLSAQAVTSLLLL